MSGYSSILASGPKSGGGPASPKFKRIFIVVGLILGFLLFKTSTSWSMNAEDQIIKEALTNLYRLNPKSRGANPYDATVTADRLAKFFPFDESPKRIIKNIFQMWKVPLTDPDFPHKDLVTRWKNENPTYKYNLFTDDEILEHLRIHFKDTVPEVVEAFELMPNKIIQSDFARYLLIYLNGGVYSDIDTQLQKPVDTWFDSDRNVGFVVAVEEDMNIENWEHYMTRRVQFEQWTFKAKARHPVLRKLIAKIVETTYNAKKNKKLQAYYKDFKGVDRCSSIDIMEWTGPVVWTDTIYAHLNSLENPTIIDIDPSRDSGNSLYGPETDENQVINWRFLTGLKAPVMIDDVVIYPKLSFREDPENNCGKYCYVWHQFGGSWKNNGKGEIKPGEEGFDENAPAPEENEGEIDRDQSKRKRDLNEEGHALKKRSADCLYPYHAY